MAGDEDLKGMSWQWAGGSGQVKRRELAVGSWQSAKKVLSAERKRRSSWQLAVFEVLSAE